MIGHTNMICVVTATGTLTNCVINQERPLGYGFGRAALMASRYFKMHPHTITGTPVEGASVAIPITWMVADAKHHKIVVESPGVATAPVSDRDWDADYPGDVQASGVEGVVWVRATVGVDGRASAISIRDSARAPALDGAAMSALSEWRFQPARDAAGQPMAATIAVEFRFDPMSFASTRCATLTAHAAWVAKAWPERKISDFRLYRDSRNYISMNGRDWKAPGGEAAFYQKFAAAFDRSVAACVAQPDAKLVEVMDAAFKAARD